MNITYCQILKCYNTGSIYDSSFVIQIKMHACVCVCIDAHENINSDDFWVVEL